MSQAEHVRVLKLEARVAELEGQLAFLAAWVKAFEATTPAQASPPPDADATKQRKAG